MTAPELQAEVLFSPGELPDPVSREHRIVVIDVLRATTVIGTALAAGAALIIPAPGVAEALALKAQIDPAGALLCGERGGRPIPGFDLGNSPAEYRREAVAGRTLILASTNGSVALARSQPARRVLAASFNTLGAVAARMPEDGGAWTIVCSGKLGRPALEDLVAAGALLDRLGVARGPASTDAAAGAGESPSAPVDSLDAATDAIRIALDLYDDYRDDLLAMLKGAAHGRYLAAIGYADDLEIAARVDTLDVVPEMSDGRIVDGRARRDGPSAGAVSAPAAPPRKRTGTRRPVR
jgi:2-phosphosulfolactate phosphatase